MKKNSLVITLVCLLIAVACSSAKKSFEKQNYEKAYRLALKSIEKEKNVKEHKNILKRSLEKIERIERKEYEKEISNSDLESKEKAYNRLFDLAVKFTESSSYLDTSFLQRADDYGDEVTILKNELASSFYARGESNFLLAKQRDDKKMAQNVYYDFTKSKKYGAKYRNLDSLQLASQDFATINYELNAEPIFDLSFSWEIDRVFRQLQTNGLFYKVYYDPTGFIDDIDCIIDVRFNSLDISTSENQQSETFTERVIADYKITKDTSGHEIKEPIYENVSATVVTNRRVKTVSWSANVHINGRTKHCNLSNNNFSDSISDEIVIISSSGDERAIPSQFKNPRNESFDSDNDMANSLINSIYQRIRSYYF